MCSLLCDSWWFLEFVALLVIPQLLVTSASHLIPAVLTTLLVAAIALTVYTVSRQRGRSSAPADAEFESESERCSARTCSSRRLAFLSWARGSLALLTGVSILAVDFVHFPARLSKCYVHGVSLMDSGAGLVVFLSAWTSAAARPINTSPPNTLGLALQ